MCFIHCKKILKYYSREGISTKRKSFTYIIFFAEKMKALLKLSIALILHYSIMTSVLRQTYFCLLSEYARAQVEEDDENWD